MLFEQLLKNRGLSGASLEEFLHPDYDKYSQSYNIPDIDKAVKRLKTALKKQEKIIIHGDYDVDGVSATALLLDALTAFGFKNIDYILPDRVTDGYGISRKAIHKAKDLGCTLIVTVDCGSSSPAEVDLAKSLNIDVIITDHHDVKKTLPRAVAIVNPKRADSVYPLPHLSGVGVALKLVQALQQQLTGLPAGQEKWFLDLVALGTICDVMELKGENRTNVYYGLKVLTKTRRPGLKALSDLAGVKKDNLSSRSVAFQLGPRLNAAGRIDTADMSLKLLIEKSKSAAYAVSEILNDLNTKRRELQDQALQEALVSGINQNDPVLFVQNDTWHEGIIGLIASKLTEKYHKPTFVLTAAGTDGTLKGSARSFGDFSLYRAIQTNKDLLIKGGGHKSAAGITIKRSDLTKFKAAVNKFYKSLNIKDQEKYWQVQEDLTITDISQLTEKLYRQIQTMEPFGEGNPEPIFKLENLTVVACTRLGVTGQHLKLTVKDVASHVMKLLAFSAPEEWFVSEESKIDVWVSLSLNEWNGIKNIEGKIIQLAVK